MEWARAVRDWPELRGSLWVKPAVAVVVALAGGALLSMVELPDDVGLGPLIFRGDAQDARQLLTAVTQTMITVTSVVFVLTVVALQIASSQFSPRLLRSFLRDRGTQLVLSTFVGTVAYSLAGLHTVGSPSGGGSEFVPRIAVTGALVLALVSVGMLVYYIQHITNSIRIDTIMQQVANNTLAVVRRTMPVHDSGQDARQRTQDGDDGRVGQEDAGLPTVPAGAVAVPARHAGYVQGFDLRALHDLATRDDVRIRVAPVIGRHVVPGQELAWVWNDAAPDADRYVGVVNRAVVVHHERRVEDDVGYGVRQLVDIASRMLSPSLNDPYSSVQALHHLTTVLSEMAGRDIVPAVTRDPDGRIRVATPAVPFATYIETTSSHVRWSMAERPRVALALLRLLGTVRARTDSPLRQRTVDTQIDLVVADARRDMPNHTDVESIERAAAAARRAHAGGPMDVGASWFPEA